MALGTDGRYHRWAWILLFFLGFGGFLWSQLEDEVGLPDYLLLRRGETQRFTVKLPISLAIAKENPRQILKIDDRFLGKAGLRLGRRDSVAVMPLDLGQAGLKLKLFGLIPLRTRVVDVVPPVKVVPGGQAIGVLLAPKGMIVTGYAPVRGPDGRNFFPAREAGLQAGDLLLEINGEDIRNIQQLESLVNSYGAQDEPLTLKVQRGKRILTLKVRPSITEVSPPGAGYQRHRRRYVLGIFIEDPAAGVGTLSFYDKNTRIYGALGHMITDTVTRRQSDVSNGRIVVASIAGIQPAQHGQPGEKVGTFHSEEDIVGNIDKNSPFGIYGHLAIIPKNYGAAGEVPVAMAHEIRPGKAEMLTVIDGQRVERFELEILRISHQRRPDGKGLVLRITDPRLLKLTGGIIQGMSGSPILQDGKLVGAVTHVFVNDATRGYGILAEWMLKEAGLFERAATRSATPIPRGARAALQGSPEILPAWRGTDRVL